MKMDKILKQIVDVIYRTNSKRKKLERLENTKVFAADASKGIITQQNEDIKKGIDWITSQRAVLFLTEKYIICGKWRIPLDQITKASLIKIRGGQVLKIDTENNTYQFGMQVNPEWTKQEVLPLTLQKGEMTYSLYSVVVRLLLIGYLMYWVYDRFFK